MKVREDVDKAEGTKDLGQEVVWCSPLWPSWLEWGCRRWHRRSCRATGPCMGKAVTRVELWTGQTGTRGTSSRGENPTRPDGGLDPGAPESGEADSGAGEGRTDRWVWGVGGVEGH